MSLRRRDVLTAAATLPLAACATSPAPADPLVLDDASRLNRTRVGRRASIAPTAAIEALRAELKAARAEGRPVSVGAARHSLGGQSLPPSGGTAIDLTGAALEIDSAAKTYRVSGGARWRDVIARLDPVGLSPAVTQSSHDFGVGAAVSVNAHGWPAPRGPVGSTVRSLTVMTAEGEALTCSPASNPELFRLVVGGYGLVGVILEAELEAAANVELAPRFGRVAGDEVGVELARAALSPQTRMAYARLDVTRADFLEGGARLRLCRGGRAWAADRARIAVRARPLDLPGADGFGVRAGPALDVRGQASSRDLGPRVAQQPAQYPGRGARRAEARGHRHPARIFPARGRSRAVPGRLPARDSGCGA